MLPGSHSFVISQLLLDVVALCVEIANVALDVSLVMAAWDEDRSEARGSSQACAIWTASYQVMLRRARSRHR